jgi:hypothetical protein
MTIEQFRAAYIAQPFQPFIIHLANGRQIPVPSREFVLVPPGGRTFAVYHDNAIHVMDLLLVTEFEIRAVAPRRRRP